MENEGNATAAAGGGDPCDPKKLRQSGVGRGINSEISCFSLERTDSMEFFRNFIPKTNHH